MPIARGQQESASWIDSEVPADGVCGSLYNSNRQLTGILFYVPRLSFIKVEAPALEVPLRHFCALLQGKALAVGHVCAPL